MGVCVIQENGVVLQIPVSFFFFSFLLVVDFARDSLVSPYFPITCFICFCSSSFKFTLQYSVRVYFIDG